MDKKTPNFTTPENTLKEKVGEGGIPAYLIKKCQEYLESNPVDFAPYARRFLERLELIRKDVDTKNINDEKALAEILNIVMQLKSNGSMFHFQLVSMVSDVMLHFLENVQNVNSDFLEILGVYNKVLDIILNKRLTGNGGKEGYVLTQELHGACLRYYTKNNIPH